MPTASSFASCVRVYAELSGVHLLITSLSMTSMPLQSLFPYLKQKRKGRRSK